MSSHKSSALLCILSCMFSLSAYANNVPSDNKHFNKLKLGLNIATPDYGYIGKKNLSVLPHGFYDGNKLYLEGGEGGIYLYKSSKHHVRAGILFDGKSLNPSDISLQDLSDAGVQNSSGLHIQRRTPSIFAGINYTHITPIGAIRAKASVNILDNHHGKSASVAHISRFTHNNLRVYPSVGIQFYDKDYNQYYYNVTNNQDLYAPKSSANAFASLLAEYQINDDYSMFLHGRVQKLASAQTNSPLINKKYEKVIRTGLSYQF